MLPDFIIEILDNDETRAFLSLQDNESLIFVNPDKDDYVVSNYFLRGKSAYDIAVANGFHGTEQEWLDSLKGQDIFINYVASSPIGGHRVVTVSSGNLIYADNRHPSYLAYSILGISTNAGLAGDNIKIQFNGILEEPSWNWNTALPIYVGRDGMLTQTIVYDDDLNYIRVIGMPITNKKIKIELSNIIFVK